MESRTRRKITIILLTVFLLLFHFTLLNTPAAVSNVVSLKSIESASKKYGISSSSNAYKALLSINTKYGSLLQTAADGTIIFFFEGVGNSDSESKRMNAMCVVINDHNIKYLNRNSSTIPDYPFTPSLNGGTDMPTLVSGIYSFSTVNHTKKYAALNVNNAKVVRHKSKTSDPYVDTSSGINVHRRSSDDIPDISKGWVNSAGCQIVGKSGTKSNDEYALFIKAVGIVGDDADGKTKYSKAVSGKIVIDRTYAGPYCTKLGYSDKALKLLGIPKYIVNSSIKLNKTKASMYIKSKLTLNATVSGQKGTVKWSSSNSAVATVTSKGVVTGKRSGSTTITASVNGAKAKCKITVKKPTIKLNKTSLSLSQGDNYYLKATIGGASKNTEWSTSNKSVASVVNGKVVGKKAGTAIITAKANGVAAKCKVVIKKAKITIKVNSSSKKIYKGSSFTLKATVGGSSKKVTWSSSNKNIATVSSTGKVTAKVIGKKKGSAVITAKVGEKTAKCKVKVIEKSDSSSGSGSSGGGGGCITPETMVTLADGSQKRVDKLEDTDIIKAYDFDNGVITDAPITLFHRVYEEEKVLRVEFADGTSIGVVKDHCFFDLTERCFVTIDSEDQAKELVGHNFAILRENDISEVELIDIYVDGITDSYYAPVSETYLNCFTNGLLSMPGYVKGFCNVFELEEEELKYDATKKMKEISIASNHDTNLLFAIIKNLEVYKRNRLDWLDVSVYKGMISVEELNDLYDFCRPFFVAQD